jgi:hypothetical protein
MATPLYTAKNLEKLPSLIKRTRFEGKIKHEGVKFTYEVYLFPIVEESDNTIKESLIKRIGNRIKDGKICLDIDETIVRRNIDNNDYSAMAFVKNISDPDSHDEASGTIQYFDWCQEGKPQLWLCDLCRITGGKEKPAVSPLKALMCVFENVCIKLLKNKQKYLNLMVETGKTDTDILVSIYKKYGFKIIKSGCVVEDTIAMRRPISFSKTGGGTRKKSQGINNKSNRHKDI